MPNKYGVRITPLWLVPPDPKLPLPSPDRIRVIQTVSRGGKDRYVIDTRVSRPTFIEDLNNDAAIVDAVRRALMGKLG